MTIDMKGFDKDKNINESLFRVHKYGFMSLIGMIGMAFLLGWLFLVPALAVVFLTYSLIIYLKERKNRILVMFKPTEEMRAIARKEEELRLEKERLLQRITQ